MKTLLRYLLVVLLMPVALVALLVFLFYLPPVQQWAVEWAARYASEQTGLEVRVGRLRVTPLLDVELRGVRVAMPGDTMARGSKPDTLLYIARAMVDLDFGRIREGRLAVEGIDLRGGRFDTQRLLASVQVKGRMGAFHVAADEIAWNDGLVKIPLATLCDSEVDILLRDTTDIDTTESTPLPWRIEVGRAEVLRSRVGLLMEASGDPAANGAIVNRQIVKCAEAWADTLRTAGADIDLLGGRYCVQDIAARMDSVRYEDLTVRSIALDAKDFCFADGRVQLPFARLATAPVQPFLPSSMALTLSGEGNADTLRIDSLHLTSPDLVDARLCGTLSQFMDLGQMQAEVHCDVRTGNLSPLRRLLSLPSNVALPPMHLTGHAKKLASLYEADMRLQQGAGTATLKGAYDMEAELYRAAIDIRNLNLHNFLPKDSLYQLTASARAEGRGVTAFSPATRLSANVDVEHLRYGQHDIDLLSLRARMKQGQGYVEASSDNDVLAAHACATLSQGDGTDEGSKRQKRGKLMTINDFSLELARLDLHALGLVPKPLTAALHLHLDGSTNFRDAHRLAGRMEAMQLQLADTVLHPLDLDCAVHLLPDSLHAVAHAGDLELQLAASESLDSLLRKATLVGDELARQLRERRLDQSLLRSLMPTMQLHLTSGPKNPMGNFLAHVFGYTFQTLQADVTSTPQRGIRGRGSALGFNLGGMQLDTIQWYVRQKHLPLNNLQSDNLPSDSLSVVPNGSMVNRPIVNNQDGVQTLLRVRNNKRNKQAVFEARLMGELLPTGASLVAQFFDAKGEQGVNLGAQATVEDDGIRVHLHPLNPVIAYRNFTLNEDNYIYLHADRRVEALVDLLADDGTGFKLYSTPNADALQDLTLSVHDFNLGELSTVMPYLPSIQGLLAGDFHLIQEERSLSVSADAQVAGMVFEGAPIGNLGLNALYLPNADGTHYVDGLLFHEGEEVMSLVGTYNPEGQGTIDASGQLMRLPLALANGFIPDRMAALSGFAHGEIEVRGSVARPDINGQFRTEGLALDSDPYSVHLRFPDDTIRIHKSLIDLDCIAAYSGRSALTLDGTIDARNTSAIGLNLSVAAKNFELINAPKSRKAVAYGKVYVDLDTRITGTLNDMKLRGALNVLGNTDVTYVLTDSPLTVEDQLADLVTFVDFTDTTTVEQEETLSPQHIDLRMDIGIEQATQAHCLLSADGTNYVDIEGGGDLKMTYNNRDGLRLQGRYTVVSGKMNYTLMVMALKDLALHPGSYVEWTGDVMNPRLSLQATEHVKTTVYENSVPRSVAFDVGLAVSQTLDNMGLEFTLDAPDDMAISNQLATMTPEARGKVAVTMLATGMYLTDGNQTTGFSGTNALNAFLQHQLSAISNKALGTIDVNFGIDNTNTASGAMQTDYNFSFAKRFWGNRISLIIGGKVSSGSEAQNTGQSIIDNVSLEYRLDKSATRFVRLYYDRNTASLMEGEVMEMGAGMVFRRKSTRLGELFLFKSHPHKERGKK